MSEHTAHVSAPTALSWDDGRWVAGAPDTGALSVADSWLVQDGRARGLDLHRARFGTACAQSGVDPAAFWDAALARIPRLGAWFPRVELAATSTDPRLRLRLRPAPERRRTVRVWVLPTPDPRRVPRWKGPDLDLLGRLRRDGLGHGAEEVLLRGTDGTVLEAAGSALWWWEGDTLCRPDPALPVLASVTSSIVERLAARAAIPVAHRRARLDDLRDREVWLVNALHGIRAVTAWVGPGHPPVARSVRASRWQQGWDDTAEPLPPAVP